MLLDYLVIGHVTCDLNGSSLSTGGTATYAARTAQALGCRVGIITSAGVGIDLSESLSDVLITRLLAPTSTTFENIYTGAGRRQVIHNVARPLGLEALPDGWRARLVHVGPVARECDPAFVGYFGEAFVGVTPQGWMREWDEEGYVSRSQWEDAGLVLPYADAVVLSEEDVRGDRSVVAEYAREAPCLALTQGAAGCTVYADGQVRHFPAPSVEEVDPTGAGDVFATSLFYALQRGHDAWTAACFANCLAAQSVTRRGILGTPSKLEVVQCSQAAFG